MPVPFSEKLLKRSKIVPSRSVSMPRPVSRTVNRTTFFISSGAVEVILPGQKVRLGRGDFFGEMALLSGKPRTADVVALGFCQLLVLSAADFRRFLAAHATAKAEIDRIVEARILMNEESARTLSAGAI